MDVPSPATLQPPAPDSENLGSYTEDVGLKEQMELEVGSWWNGKLWRRERVLPRQSRPGLHQPSPPALRVWAGDPAVASCPPVLPVRWGLPSSVRSA